MATSGITANTDVTVAAFAQAIAKHVWDASSRGSTPTARMLEWKDFVDAVIVSLQARVAQDASLGNDLTITDLLTTGRLAFGGTALNANGTDFALSAGWGVGAAIGEGTVVGTASAFSIGEILPAGTPAANPTVTLTFPVARASAPLFAIPVVTDFNASAGAHSWSFEAASTTTIQFRHIGTPVADEAVGLSVLVIG